jgi:hypothetical protein
LTPAPAFTPCTLAPFDTQNMSTEITREKHRFNVARYDAEASSIERALAESRRLDQLETRMNDLVDDVLAAYEEFCVWAEAAEAVWAGRPDRYDAAAHADVRTLRAGWRETLRACVAVTDHFLDRDGIEPVNTSRLRKVYSELLSIEMMDRGPMPESMRALSDAAIEDIEAGRLEEI